MPLHLLDPELTVLVPLTPNALPALVETLCSHCQGACYLDAYDPDAGSQRCPECFGRGALDVCPKCGTVPDSGTDVCGCVQVCENCATRPAVHDCLCSVCILEAYRKTLEEDPEGLKRYQDLRDRELTPQEVSAEVAWASSLGWL